MTDNMTKLFEEALVLDTETTSLDFKEAEVIEYSSATIIEILKTVAMEEYELDTQLYKPSKPISFKISSITGITNRMVENEELFEEDLEVIQKELDSVKYYIAHNAFYDTKVLERYDLKLPQQLCTMRLAKKLCADDTSIEEYNLSYLRYALNLPVPDDLIAHRADADVMMTGMLFVQLLERAIADGEVDADADDLGAELVAYLEKPVKTKVMPFGKHKGKKLVDVPLDYWQWALENFDSLQEDKPEYDKDFAASVAEAVQEIFDNT